MVKTRFCQAVNPATNKDLEKYAELQWIPPLIDQRQIRTAHAIGGPR